ncbi:5,10-methylenetetrahydrofolate dehydrogenase (NADP+), methenyltetrahydrofolate cyclohydrolase [Sulfobacillus acidophilus DSM 10332]|uniref:Bifunctional protein FolD n=1 Tax=Sulfobacillus acidophilus (strain ATCC 700253 / DSM 10332 / NAL) TaxID=679936 RepID=G8TYF1_SULAD|nr:5,10-methylenetetrahydrofolate dehydrogenase (NADP+), methenyltetrahydrofolate cyclohydrolase [Sulfobacillus acidophilus DSM 10332]
MTEPMLLNGQRLAAEMRGQLAAQIARVRAQGYRAPGLAVILVGDDPASAIYVRNKKRAAQEIGIEPVDAVLPQGSTTEDVLRVVDQFNQDPAIDGILVQMPLPPQIETETVLARVRPDKDVDGLTVTNLGRLTAGEEGLVPCTPKGILRLLEAYDIALAGRRAVVVGRSRLVGLPVALLLMQRQATVTVIHSRTPEPETIARQADILVVAAGKPHLVTEDWIKPGAVVIDVGIHRGDHGLLGDVDRERVWSRVGALSPVPGGVGPMTILELLDNTWTAYRRHEGLSE